MSTDAGVEKYMLTPANIIPVNWGLGTREIIMILYIFLFISYVN